MIDKWSGRAWRKSAVLFWAVAGGQLSWWQCCVKVQLVLEDEERKIQLIYFKSNTVQDWSANG